MARILIACEESQTVCKAFRALGHEAYSCDILPASGGHPEWHIQGDCLEEINNDYKLIISFQPCTDLAVSGARWFAAKRLSGEQEQSIKFFLDVWQKSNCSENPIGIMNGGTYIKKWFPKLYEYAKFIGFPFKPSQIIQPWQFGQKETKATCLWLRGLPLLQETSNVKVWMDMEPTHVKHRIHYMPPGPDRAKLRSKTYSGIASAIATQYSPLLNT